MILIYPHEKETLGVLLSTKSSRGGVLLIFNMRYVPLMKVSLSRETQCILIKDQSFKGCEAQKFVV